MPKSNAPVERFSVAFEGFGEFERSALASFFRLAAKRTPAYEQIDSTAHADFVIANADLAPVRDALRHAGRTADTVFVGARAPQDAMAWLPRPIDPVHILRELDALVQQRHATPSLYADEPEAADDAVDLLLDIDPGFQAAALAEPPAAAQMQYGGAGHGREVLVVDDSAIARKFLTLRLERLGYRVQTAASGDAALERLGRHRFRAVFLDIALGEGGVDGLHVCQTIKQRRAGPGTNADAAVVMVTGMAGSADRVRGSLAGCDAYLTKPLMEAEFVAALRQVDPEFAAAA